MRIRRPFAHDLVHRLALERRHDHWADDERQHERRHRGPDGAERDVLKDVENFGVSREWIQEMVEQRRFRLGGGCTATGATVATLPRPFVDRRDEPLEPHAARAFEEDNRLWTEPRRQLRPKRVDIVGRNDA